VVVSGLAFLAPSISAQPAPTLRAEIETLKVDIAALKTAVANAPTLAQALQDMSTKLVVLEQELGKSARLNESVPQVITELDALKEGLHKIQEEVAYLRTGIANIEQPAVSSGGSNSHKVGSGMTLSTEDGLYSLTLGGYLHTRYQTQLPEDMSTVDSAGFSIRRGRLEIDGQAGSKRLSYNLNVELSTPNAPLRDYYMDMHYRDELKIRVGQAKLPFTRPLIASSKQRIFHEFNETQDLHRYDRDIGVWALGTFLDGRLRYHGGFSNGAGQNVANENIDLATALRIEGVALGKYIKPGFSDVEGTDDPALTLGLAAVHDLVRVPEDVAGIEVPNRDVDGNGIEDNVRVLSTVMDAQFRFQGFECFVEGTWRHERWGTIVEHGDNADLAAAINASNSGRRNYLGVSAQASYFVLPSKLLVGARVSHGRLPLLGVSGRSLTAGSAPLAERAMQIDGIVQLYRDGYRRVGLSYNLLNYNEKNGAEPANDIGHTFVLEAQLLL
jgi:hypothetical protein